MKVRIFSILVELSTVYSYSHTNSHDRSLLTTDAEHLFVCLLTFTYLWKNVRPFAHFPSELSLCITKLQECREQTSNKVLINISFVLSFCYCLTFLMLSLKYQHFQFSLGPIWIVFSLFWAPDNIYNEVFPNLRSAFILVFSSWGSVSLVTLGPDSS